MDTEPPALDAPVMAPAESATEPPAPAATPTEPPAPPADEPVASDTEPDEPDADEPLPTESPPLPLAPSAEDSSTAFPCKLMRPPDAAPLPALIMAEPPLVPCPAVMLASDPVILMLAVRPAPIATAPASVESPVENEIAPLPPP